MRLDSNSFSDDRARGVGGGLGVLSRRQDSYLRLDLGLDLGMNLNLRLTLGLNLRFGKGGLERDVGRGSSFESLDSGLQPCDSRRAAFGRLPRGIKFPLLSFKSESQLGEFFLKLLVFSSELGVVLAWQAFVDAAIEEGPCLLRSVIKHRRQVDFELQRLLHQRTRKQLRKFTRLFLQLDRRRCLDFYNPLALLRLS